VWGVVKIFFCILYPNTIQLSSDLETRYLGDTGFLGPKQPLTESYYPILHTLINKSPLYLSKK
jgi:hypothetical protein